MERERLAMVEGGKAPRRQVGQQGRLAQQVLIIAIAGPQGCFVHMGSDDPSGNQTVLPEVIHNADELAFQVQVGILQKNPVNELRWNRGQGIQSRLPVMVAPRSCCQANGQHLAGPGKADGKLSGAPDVAVSVVARGADEAEVVTPPQRHGHVFGG